MKLIFVLLATLAGCAQIAANTPSLEYCSEVHYTRVGNQIDISAKCAAPIAQSSGMAIPLPKP